MSQKVEGDVSVRRLAFVSDEQSRRLIFPHAVAQKIEGAAGSLSYGATDLVMDGLEGRFDGLRWAAESASLGELWLRGPDSRFEMTMHRVELPRGIMVVRAAKGVEIVAPHATLSDARFVVHDLMKPRNAEASPVAEAPKEPTPATPRPTPPPQEAVSPRPPLRQEAYHFLDGVAGKFNLTIKAKLDLPVIGTRTLDQELKIPIADGSLDFRALDKSLDWLEGTFIDIDVDGDRLVLSFKVPIFGSTREIISWALDADAEKLAQFGRVPLRSLVDFRTARSPSETKNGGKNGDKKEKKSILKSLTLDAIDVVLSMLAPRSLDVGGGVIMFGGDDAPGIVNLQLAGSINDHTKCELRGAAGSVDTTIKDLSLGSVKLTADRLSLDRIEDLHVTFDGYSPTAVTAAIHRVTASNLSLIVGG